MAIPPTQHVNASNDGRSAYQNLERLESAVRVLNANRAFGDDTELILVMDSNRRRTVVQLIDRQTRQILNQIPPTTIFQLVNKFAR